MTKFLKKKYYITLLASLFLFVGVSFKSDFFEIAKQIEIFTLMFKTVNQNYVDETNPGELMNIAIKNMLQDLDPYTVFFNEQDVQKFKINNTGEYTGIGAMVQRKNGKVYLKEIYKGFPADKAGLKAGDEITVIGDVNLQDYKEDASQLLRGAKNTTVNIQYIRQGKKNNASIVLDEVEIKSVPYYTLLSDNTAYIVLSKFNDRASSEVKNALLELKGKGANKLILDLRQNPGGLLQEAVNICNLFVPKGEVIVTTKSKNPKHNNSYKTEREPIDLEIPIVVVIDGKSASASEIVSGALQDLDRAVIVGARSLVQRPLNLSYGTQVKVTISRYYTPSGRCIQALDYSHKDENGKAIKKNANEFNAFKTKSGRIVYDGGGVKPDIEFEETKKSTVADALEKNDALFNFATQLYYKNPNLTEAPKLTDADFEQFKIFLKQENINFDTQTEKSIKNVWETAQKESIDTSIQQEYNALLTALQRQQENALSASKKEILNWLTEDLITRYLYKEGLYNYLSKNNLEVQKAQELLNNSSKYMSYLKK